jgi:hypothetical protein
MLTPLGPPQVPSECAGVQGAWSCDCRPRPRPRLCLLKGCERSFLPPHPQSRYCSAECRAAARRWRRWRASRMYRSSEQGRTRRREQAQRYRQRMRMKQPESSAQSGEGQRPVPVSKESCCARPGCYELFQPNCRSPLQKCCGSCCRLALRRVRQREARWRRRRFTAADELPAARGSPYG